MQEAGARNNPKKGPVTAVNDWDRDASHIPSSPGQSFYISYDHIFKARIVRIRYIFEL